jgi:hypothetical protein
MEPPTAHINNIGAHIPWSKPETAASPVNMTARMTLARPAIDPGNEFLFF